MNSIKMTALGLFLAFSSYFSLTGWFLANGAGPDFVYSRAAADFYHAENRMAVYPDDVDKMVFSRYGNSRLLRPPLGYFYTAQLVKLPILKDLLRSYAYRVATALLAGLTVMFIFLALRLYFDNYWYAVFGATSLGLMPQFGFYASYFSDDMVAFLTSSILAYTIVLIYKRGLSLSRQIFFAFAAGLCIVSKQTAWIFIIPAIVFYFIFMLNYSFEYFKSRNFFQPFIFMSIAFIVGGGWWLLFNVYQYGPNNFQLSDIAVELMNNHATIPVTNIGYDASNIGIKQLLIVNYHNFIGNSYIAFVGNLDWLRLKVGSLQYGFYLWVVIGIVLNSFILLYQMIEFGVDRLKRLTFEQFPRAFVFELILYFAIALQVYLYTRHNVYTDIQIQGKYLMAVFIPMLILALSFYSKVLNYLNQRFDQFELPRSVKIAFIIVLIATPVLIHLDAIVMHVIPFYWPEVSIYSDFDPARR